MLTAKKDIIDAYGHFFVLCERSDPSETHEDGYVSRVFNNAGYYNEVGNLDAGWSPRNPKKLEILEFFGKPKESHSWGVGVLNGMNPLYEYKNRSIFSTVEEAEKKAEEIRAEHKKMYKKLQEIGKRRTLEFNTETPDMPVIYNLQPEEVEFPALMLNDAVIYGFVRNPGSRPLEIFSSKIGSAELFAEQINGSKGPFKYNYRLDISVSVPVPGKEDLRYLIDQSFYTNDDYPGEWGRYDSNRGAPPGMSEISYALSKEGAEEKMRQYAERVYANIRHLLSEGAAPAPYVANESAPSGP